MDEPLAARADTVLKEITLWDSQGQKEGNQIHLRAMHQYVRDKYQEIHGESNMNGQPLGLGV